MKMVSEILKELKAKREELKVSKREFESFEVNPNDFKEKFEKELNDYYGEIKIMNASFRASDIVEKLNYTAFREGLLEYVDCVIKHGPRYRELWNKIRNLEENIERLEAELFERLETELQILEGKR